MGYPRSTNTYVSNATAVSGIIGSNAGAIKSITACNTAAADRFLMFFDTVALPNLGDVPYLVFPVYKNNGYTEIHERILTSNGQVFSNGIVWGMSTTPGTYTAGVATDALLQVRWV